MHFIYEEGGEIKGASAIGQASPAADSWAAQTQFGKRIKLKAKEVWLKWEGGELVGLLDLAKSLAAEVDIDLLWECLPDTEFAFAEVAKEYFGNKVGQEHLIGLAMALQNAPIYFRRKGRGNFVRAPEEQLKAALLSVERKKQEANHQEQLKEQMIAGMLPPEIAQNANQLLFAPDKNHYIYKALASASQHRGISSTELLMALGAIHSALEIHQGKFLKEHFPRGLHFPASAVVPASWQTAQNELPLAQVAAFSIDDATTTEIDDAFSVTLLPNANYQIGIHIAAPSLVVQAGDAIDQLASHRMSTAYFPGGKITMLPASIIEVFSLDAGHARPAISLYVEVSPEGALVSVPPHRTVIERVPIKENLRLHSIEDLLTEEFLEKFALEPTALDVDTAIHAAKIPFLNELNLLWLCAQNLFAKRQEVRVANGQRADKLRNTDPNTLLKDFNFEVVSSSGQPLKPDDVLQQPVDDASWLVNISTRSRGSVVDTIVAEWMIFSNQTWGTYLAQNDLPAIFRAQQGWGAQRTRMQTTPCRHEGLGVENYAWCTSPLRRYSDLVNQWQLIALVQHGMMAKLAAPFAPKDTKIMGLCAEFDERYSSYNNHQQIVERYWCLRWLEQQGLPFRTQARTLKEGMVRLESIPLRLQIPELVSTPRGVTVDIEIVSTDLLNLTASVRVIQLFESSLDHQAENESDLSQIDLDEEMMIPKIQLDDDASALSSDSASDPTSDSTLNSSIDSSKDSSQDPNSVSDDLTPSLNRQ